MGVFAYSDEDTAKSFALDEQSGRGNDRATPRHADGNSEENFARGSCAAQVGQTLTAMLEGPSKDTDLVWEARLEGMAPEIDGKVYITEIAGVTDAAQLPPPGTMARVEITESNDYDLIGRAVEIISADAAIPQDAQIRRAPISNPRIVRCLGNDAARAVHAASMWLKPLSLCRDLRRRAAICRPPKACGTNPRVQLP